MAFACLGSVEKSRLTFSDNKINIEITIQCSLSMHVYWYTIYCIAHCDVQCFVHFDVQCVVYCDVQCRCTLCCAICYQYAVRRVQHYAFTK